MISPTTIAAIRERTDIVALIGETVKLARKGRSHMGRCPFHKEKTPSFSVSQENGFFYCFGCKESGTAFDFLMKTEGLTFPEAARQLAERAGIEIEETSTDAERKEADAARRAMEDLYAVNALAAHYFETQLREHPHAAIAKKELARRGLVAAEGDATGPIAHALQAFRVGYAPSGWDGLTNFLRQQGVSPVAAEKVGLLAARKSGSGYYDWFRHRLMFAIIDVQGRVVGFSGRVLADPETGIVDKETGKYVNSPESPIYKKGDTLFGLYQARQSIRSEESAVLVEGNFDVVSLHARGVTNVVAPLGTAFTAAQGKLLRRYTPVVTLLFDGDAAGRKATRDAREVCRAAGLSAKVAVLPDGKDPDDVAKERGAEGIAATIKAARGILEHLIEASLDEKFLTADAHERATRLREIGQLIQSEEDPAVKAMAKTIADQVASRLGLPGVTSFDNVQRAVEQHVNAALAGSGSGVARDVSTATTTEPPWRARSAPQHEELGRAILGCFFDFPSLLDDPTSEVAIAQLEGDAALTVAAMRQTSHSEADVRNGLYAAEILAHVPASIHTFAARRLAAPRHENPDEARMELLSNSQKLKRLGLSRDSAEVVKALHEVGRAGDSAAEDALLREIFAKSSAVRAKKHDL